MFSVDSDERYECAPVGHVFRAICQQMNPFFVFETFFSCCIEFRLAEKGANVTSLKSRMHSESVNC